METIVVVNGLRFAGAGRMLGFLEQQEPPGGTLVTARRHTSDAWCSDSRKMLFFVFFAEQELLGVGFLPLGTRRHHFSSSYSFCKIPFFGSLTVRFR